jgi:tetratricopeptide (TPR) repeat protein
VGDVLGEANCVQSLGDIARLRFAHDLARQRYEQALPLYRKVGDLLGQGNCILSLGELALRRSDSDTARQCFQQALAYYERIPQPYSIGQAHRQLADLATTDDDRSHHLRLARDAWASIGRDDLIAQLPAAPA